VIVMTDLVAEWREWRERGVICSFSKSQGCYLHIEELGDLLADEVERLRLAANIAEPDATLKIPEDRRVVIDKSVYGNHGTLVNADDLEKENRVRFTPPSAPFSRDDCVISDINFFVEGGDAE
jgi:hypothetical protein